MRYHETGSFQMDRGLTDSLVLYLVYLGPSLNIQHKPKQ